MLDKGKCSQLFLLNQEKYLEEWRKFLSFKSISADPAFDQDCRLCAAWLKDHLISIGFEAQLLETNSKPLVYGRHAGKEGSPRVLFYGHYDVQPVDPVEAWHSDPFSPELRQGRLYARGASDNKGQVMYFLKAAETLIERNELDCPLTVIIEGEEESASVGLSASLNSLRDKLAAQVLLVCDSGCVRAGVPCITMGIRGLIWVEVKLGGIKYDLHSGSYGGVVKNPAVEMARLIASLHDKHGRIAVPGYYDSATFPSLEDKRLADQVPFDRAQFISSIGVEPCGGEAGLSYAERRGMRPTIEVNGLHSGYGGPGSKTIIPASAYVKLTSRLVAGQDPERCLKLLLAHLRSHAPCGLEMEILDQGIGGPAVSLSSKSGLVEVAREVLKTVGGEQVDFTWEGGSIPIVASLAKTSGAEPLLVGFGQEEDCVHAPNESFSLSQFRDGYTYACLMLSRLAGL